VWRDKQWQPATFYSRQTKGPEVGYSATELKALAVAETLAHFTYYLYGREFGLFKDHKSLCHLLTLDRLYAIFRRLAMKLQQWIVKIEYLPGKDNSAADALSRQDWEDDIETEPYGPPSGGGGCGVTAPRGEE